MPKTRSRPSRPAAPARTPSRPTGCPLTVPQIERLLQEAMGRNASFAEVYVERSTTIAAQLDESKVKSAQTGLSQGVGVRVIAGAKVGYAYSDDLETDALLRAARTAALIASGGTEAREV